MFEKLKFLYLFFIAIAGFFLDLFTMSAFK